ncbi:MAG TPA: hypothetical protein VD837_19005 [Terriglobales bacterium]|nr:hypothetical protein [Terriglobales bacterium]
MPRMIDLIRQSAVPPTLMRSAARGSLSLPPAEMVEILVYLTKHPLFGDQAQLTLAGWDERSAIEIATDPSTSTEVLDYLSAPANLREALLPALLENASVPESRVVELAQTASAQRARVMLASKRVRRSAAVLETLASNSNVDSAWIAQASELVPSVVAQSCPEAPEDDVLGIEIANYLREHADEVRAAEGQPYQLLGWTAEEQAEIEGSGSLKPNASAPAAVSATVAAAKPERERQSPVQKIAKLTVGERVQLAMKGNKDERFILVRDGVRVVCNAVLESPKLTDSEVETFAAMKNVQESVLRGIAAKRKFMKNYSVMRILTANPRCPIDVSVPLLGHLLTQDLKHLSSNKNVPETVRKISYKLFRDRLTNRNG